MYINEVIREADALNPNEYTLNEKYAWIDELNATLMQEHLYKYASVELEPMEDGTYLLPEGITFEMVDRIIAQGRSIEKYDFRSFGITPLYTPRERFFVPVHCQAKGAITVIYLAQYEPIRTFENDNTRYIWDSFKSALVIPIDEMVLQVGDTVEMSRLSQTEQCGITKIEVSPSGWEGYCLAYLDKRLSGGAAGNEYWKCKRIVTDQTLVPAPYDRMYIDWILAKIAFYQNNYIVYNQQMNKFYNTLRQFDNWRISRAPADKDNKIRNWMK
ncbi:MAG: hypothetical protein IJH36_03295 [Clostridia bacterium]|nr:hypothetical protein [Clostridia bacterium]MBQ3462127.1 hypothetical protein [Clostridia bacterium]MBQ3471652.1 hypothetical protein [Clostridia bacterium]MBQ9599686.1 hypothetical protein [Clostridia bacterium]MBR0470491.1 hypothetical protein [Clostridia bacterium]